MNYDILIAASINRLNPNIVDSMQAISANTSPSVALPTESLLSNVLVHPSKTSAPTSRNQGGLTLVELMIAMLLGLFLLGGLLQIFISSRHTYTMQEGLSRLQENGRFAIDFMARDIRLAGYVGCPKSQALLSVQNVLNSTDFLYRFNTGIEGFEATSTTAWSPVMDPAGPPVISPLGGSDVITIRRADEQGFLVTGQDASSSTITLDQPATLKVCDIAVVANCETAAVFQVSDIPAPPNVLEHNPLACTPGNQPNNIGNYANGDFRLKGEVRRINTISYFVRTRPVKTDPATITPTDQISLYRRVGANTEELVEGVERMEILYGVDKDTDENAPGYGTADYYAKAGANTFDVPGDPVTTAANWAKVVSVRISLLVATIDEIASQPLAYTFNDEPHDGVAHGGVTYPLPTDRKFRRVFTTTIALRNRVP